jgi:hypothetical protein
MVEQREAIDPNCIGSRRLYRMHRLGWAFVIGSCLISATAFAQDQRLARTTKMDREISILSYARANQSCEGIDPPSLYLDKAADHGSVCFRVSTTIRLQDAIVGNLTHCIGRRIRGVTVVYIPRAGYVGFDEVRYTVIFPQARHSVFVDLTVVPGQPTTESGNVVSGVGSLPLEAIQPQGPLRACIEAVS